MEQIQIAQNYALRQATPADLRDLWRQTSETETLVEFEHRLTQSPDLEGVTLLRHGAPFGMLQAKHLANDELWLGVTSFCAENDEDCSRLLTACAGQTLANGCPRIWLRVTDAAAGELFGQAGWTPGALEAGDPLAGQKAGQWFSYALDTNMVSTYDGFRFSAYPQ